MKRRSRRPSNCQPKKKGKPAAAGGTPFSPMAASTKSKTSAAPSGGGLFDAVGKLFGGGSSGPGAAGSPFAAMASMSPAEMKEIVANVQKRLEAAAAKGRKPGAAPAAPTVSPDVMLVEIFGEIQNRQPVDLGVVAKSLWNAEFADSVANNLSEGKGDAAPTINALASLPTKAAREKLKEILHKQRTKGSGRVGQNGNGHRVLETPAAKAPRAAAARTKKTVPACDAEPARRNAVWKWGHRISSTPRNSRWLSLAQIGTTRVHWWC